jgi:hypothetical protein
MIVTPSYFEGALSIGSVEQPDVAARVQWFIRKYEPLYLAQLVGQPLCDLLEAYSNGEVAPPREEEGTEPPEGWPDEPSADARLDKLVEVVRPILAGYIYFRIRQDDETTTTGSGDVIPNVEQARRVSASVRMVQAWNEAVDAAHLMRRLVSREEYPEYTPCVGGGVFSYVNIFGL